jgi:dTDP-4-dehydrorhamnose 3,5-epimerase
MLYVPEGFAHGFQSLEDNVEIIYFVSEFYSQKSEKGIRWDDKAFKIKWPIEQIIVSKKDQLWKPFNEKTDGLN